MIAADGGLRDPARVFLEGELRMSGDSPTGLACVILEMIVAEFRQRHGVDLRSDPVALAKALASCARAARDLERWQVVNVSVPFILIDGSNPRHLDVTLTREEVLAKAGGETG
ncbi:MAG: Hsp70 family protein [Firmicutes bacterium]|nr:Hsp70 family protein [Bacillota bacterium]